MPRIFASAALSVALAACAVSPAGAHHHRHRGVPLPYPYLLHPDRSPPLSQDYRATVTGVPQADIKVIDRLRDVGPWLSQCWRAAPAPGDREITLRVAFSRDGKMIGMPKVTYLKAATPQEGDALRADLMAALQRCAPLPFTASMGSAIAGKIFNIRFILKGAAARSI